MHGITLTRCAPLLLLLATLTACGRDDGPPRFPLAGDVTYDGQPVAAGAIVFEPDGAQGNSGPAATATIAAGRFQTEPNLGTVGGPHLVRITGYDGRPPAGDEAALKPLGEVVFGPYVTNLDVPKSSATVRFDVPAMP